MTKVGIALRNKIEVSRKSCKMGSYDWLLTDYIAVSVPTKDIKLRNELYSGAHRLNRPTRGH